MILPAAALSNHIAVLGKTGSGKTTSVKLIIEGIAAAGARVCILDPIKSDHWGLISSRDGKHPGLPFKILGGPHGHVPLHSSAGRAIGELVASGKLPLSIIDMADFEAGGLQRFFVDFAPALLRKMRGILYLVMEESHEFAPKERAGFGAETTAIHYAKKLATAGRSKGIRLIVVTQRTQALHNALLGSCETVIAHRLTTPADQKPVVDWLKANVSRDIMEKVSGSLSSLATGSGWVCSGEAQIFELVKFPRIKTYDNSATPTADDISHEVKSAPVDPEELRAIIGDAVREAEANDPKRLKAQIARLESQLTGFQKQPSQVKPVPDPAALAAAEQRGFERGDLEGFGRGVRQALSDIQLRVEPLLSQINSTIYAEPPSYAPALPLTGDQTKRVTTAPAPPPPPVVLASEQVRHVEASGPGEKIAVGEKAILIAVAQHGKCRREQLSVLTGYKKSTRDAYIKRLASRGWVEASGGSVVPTAAGIDALGADYEPLPTGRALQHYWLERLPEGERKVLQIAVDRHPDAVERADIGTVTGYKKSTRDAYIKRLTARQLVTITGRGQVRAADDLFME